MVEVASVVVMMLVGVIVMKVTKKKETEYFIFLGECDNASNNNFSLGEIVMLSPKLAQAPSFLVTSTVVKIQINVIFYDPVISLHLVFLMYV